MGRCSRLTMYSSSSSSDPLESARGLSAGTAEAITQAANPVQSNANIASRRGELRRLRLWPGVSRVASKATRKLRRQKSPFSPFGIVEKAVDHCAASPRRPYRNGEPRRIGRAKAPTQWRCSGSWGECRCAGCLGCSAWASTTSNTTNVPLDPRSNRPRQRDGAHDRGTVS